MGNKWQKATDEARKRERLQRWARATGIFAGDGGRSEQDRNTKDSDDDELVVQFLEAHFVKLEPLQEVVQVVRSLWPKKRRRKRRLELEGEDEGGWENLVRAYEEDR